MGAPSGGSYPQDVYYSLKNSTQKVDSNRNWHLAFEMTGFAQGTSVSVLANFAQTGIKVWSLNMEASTSFATLSAADTVGKTHEDRALYNGPRSWYYGALNRTAAAGNFFDYGWGQYDPVSHDVIGDSLFLLKVGTATYKIWIQNYKAGSAPNYDSLRYTFRIASWDNNIDRTVTVRRSPDYMTRNFAYYNILTDTWRDREPATATWDLAFTRYGDTAYAGNVPAVYPVMGVLSNKGCEVAKVQGLTPDTNAFASQTYSTRTDMIGDDWKYTVGNPPINFALDTVSYFIKSKSTMEYYLLQFTRFDGQSTGKAVFRKKYLGVVTPTSVGTTQAAATPAFTLAPNPANSSAQLMLDATEAASGTIVVADLSGRLVQRYPAQFAQGMNGFAISTATLPTGTYVVTAIGGTWKTSAKLVVQH